MKKTILLSLLLILTISSIAQEKVYLTYQYKKTDTANADVYWITKDTTDNRLFFREYSKEDDHLRLQGFCLKSDYQSLTGNFISYHRNGNKHQKYTYVDGELDDIQAMWDEDGNPTEIVFSFARVEEKPEYPNGEAALLKHLSKNTNYPEKAKEKGIQGRVFIEFVISKTGKVTRLKVVRGVHNILDKEAMRVVATLPVWKPGTHKSKPVNVSFIVPINFKLY